MNKLNYVLKLFRKFDGHSLKELAMHLGCSISYISHLENKNKQITINALNRYSKYLGVPVSHILLFADELENNGKNKNLLKKLFNKKLFIILEYALQQNNKKDKDIKNV